MAPTNHTLPQDVQTQLQSTVGGNFGTCIACDNTGTAENSEWAWSAEPVDANGHV